MATKPAKRGLYDFYVQPAVDAFGSLGREMLRTFGWWDCRGCGALHSPRTVRYTRAAGSIYAVLYENVCSLHKPQSTE